MGMKITALVVAITIGLLSLGCARTSPEQTFDEQTPLETLSEAAKSGNPSARHELARRYYELATRLIDGTAREPAAIRILQDSEAELRSDRDKYRDNYQYHNSNSPEAAALMDKCDAELEKYKKLKASVEEKEIKEAIGSLDIGIALNHTGSMVLLASLYNDGTRVPQNFERAVELYQKAAGLGDLTAMGHLGAMYGNGRGVTRDVNEAENWYKKACEKGDFRSCAVLATVLADGGWDGKDEGYPKDAQRAYVLGRALQLASEQGSPAFQWGGQAVQKARQHLEPDQLIPAETEAEKEAERLRGASGVKAGETGPTIDLKNPGTITKQQWKTALGRIQQMFAVSGQIQMSKSDFIRICGEPQKTQTVGDSVFWYYQCKDGDIQLELDNGNLLGAGIVTGHANDY